MSDLYTYLTIVLTLPKQDGYHNPVLNMREHSHTANSKQSRDANFTLLALKPVTWKCSISIICFSKGPEHTRSREHCDCLGLSTKAQKGEVTIKASEFRGGVGTTTWL